MRKNKSAPTNNILNDELLVNGDFVVESFAKFFKNTFTSIVEGADILNDIVPNNYINSALNISISIDDDIFKCIKKLKANMTMGTNKVLAFTYLLTYIREVL